MCSGCNTGFDLCVTGIVTEEYKTSSILRSPHHIFHLRDIFGNRVACDLAITMELEDSIISGVKVELPGTGCASHGQSEKSSCELHNSKRGGRD